MLFIDTQAMEIISRTMKDIKQNYKLTFNKGMYEPHCTANCAVGMLQ
jgi:hypothetical protein